MLQFGGNWYPCLHCVQPSVLLHVSQLVLHVSEQLCPYFLSGQTESQGEIEKGASLEILGS